MNYAMSSGDPFARYYPTPETTESAATPVVTVTHESYLASIRDLGLARLTDATAAAKLAKVKLVYGVGDGSYHGVCFPNGWEHDSAKHDVIEIAATGERSKVQLAGTVLHEYGHALANLSGSRHGHDAYWKDCAILLGLVRPTVVGANVSDDIDPTLWAAIDALPVPNDGSPAMFLPGGVPVPGFTPRKDRGCNEGRGSKGGKGFKSNRHRLYHCACQPPIKVRAATDDLAARCLLCDEMFTLQSKG